MPVVGGGVGADKGLVHLIPMFLFYMLRRKGRYGGESTTGWIIRTVTFRNVCTSVTDTDIGATVSASTVPQFIHKCLLRCRLRGRRGKIPIPEMVSYSCTWSVQSAPESK